MNPGDPRPLLDRHAARVLARWRELLRALPPSSALADPDLLAPLMAPALARVRQEATKASDLSTEPATCRCGLNPLVAFYLTGETATFDVLWAQPDALAPLSKDGREHVCLSLRQAWRRVAADEIAVFCSVCKLGEAMAGAEAPAKNGEVAANLSEPAPDVSAILRDKPLATGRQSDGTHG